MPSTRILPGLFLACVATLYQAGCAVQRGQETVGAYIDDAAITSSVKLRLAESKAVSATAIGVETLNGVVQLSGFARSAAERSAAEKLAREVKGVKAVRNEIAIQP